MSTSKELSPRQLWVQALRSGEYKQTTGKLQDAEGFCCLGVACDVARKHGVSVYIDKSSGFVSGHDLGDQKLVAKWLGLEQYFGCYDSGSLTELNDCDGWTFNQLADLIESEPEGLFKD